MAKQKNKKRSFNEMSYCEVQSSNSNKRKSLHKKDQKWLKDNGYKNVGWEQVINLYQKIADFLEKYKLEDFTLEELFLEADYVGNKYLNKQEIETFNQKLANEVNKVAEEIERQFPDTTFEFIDFSQKVKKS